MDKNVKTGRTIYCHFSFRRPRDGVYGLFAVAFYLDYEGKVLEAQATRKLPLWENHQFITAIQSYEHALYSIYNWQGEMKKQGVTEVMLVTDNSILAGWIQNPKKNKEYTSYMNKAVEQYRTGGPKEIQLNIGLCEVRNYEKSYKFCREDKIINNVTTIEKSQDNSIHKINLDTGKIAYKTVSEIEKENLNKPEIIGF